MGATSDRTVTAYMASCVSRMTTATVLTVFFHHAMAATQDEDITAGRCKERSDQTQDIDGGSSSRDYERADHARKHACTPHHLI